MVAGGRRERATKVQAAAILVVKTSFQFRRGEGIARLSTSVSGDGVMSWCVRGTKAGYRLDSVHWQRADSIYSESLGNCEPKFFGTASFAVTRAADGKRSDADSFTGSIARSQSALAGKFSCAGSVANSCRGSACDCHAELEFAPGTARCGDPHQQSGSAGSKVAGAAHSAEIRRATG